jgi:hypothetical protein
LTVLPLILIRILIYSAIQPPALVHHITLLPPNAELLNPSESYRNYRSFEHAQQPLYPPRTVNPSMPQRAAVANARIPLDLMLEPCERKERKWITSQILHLSRQGLSPKDRTAYNHGFNGTNISQDKSDQSSHATSYYKRDDRDYRDHSNLEFQWQRSCKPKNLTVFISLFSFPFSNEPTFKAVEVPQPSYD